MYFIINQTNKIKKKEMDDEKLWNELLYNTHVVFPLPMPIKLCVDYFYPFIHDKRYYTYIGERLDLDVSFLENLKHPIERTDNNFKMIFNYFCWFNGLLDPKRIEELFQMFSEQGPLFSNLNYEIIKKKPMDNVHCVDYMQKKLLSLFNYEIEYGPSKGKIFGNLIYQEPFHGRFGIKRNFLGTMFTRGPVHKQCNWVDLLELIHFFHKKIRKVINEGNDINDLPEVRENAQRQFFSIFIYLDIFDVNELCRESRGFRYSFSYNFLL